MKKSELKNKFEREYEELTEEEKRTLYNIYPAFDEVGDTSAELVAKRRMLAEVRMC